MRHVSRKELEEEAKVFAHDHVERLAILNKNGLKRFRDTQKLLQEYEEFYVQFLRHRMVVTP